VNRIPRYLIPPPRFARGRDEVSPPPPSPESARGTIIANPSPRGSRLGRPAATIPSRLYLGTPFGTARNCRMPCF
jgi:hypothetical protein